MTLQVQQSMKGSGGESWEWPNDKGKYDFKEREGRRKGIRNLLQFRWATWKAISEIYFPFIALLIFTSSVWARSSSFSLPLFFCIICLCDYNAASSIRRSAWLWYWYWDWGTLGLRLGLGLCCCWCWWWCWWWQCVYLFSGPRTILSMGAATRRRRTTIESNNEIS